MNWLFLYIIGLAVIHGSLVGFGPKTLIGTRSQGVNSVRELVSWQQQINQYNKGYNYGTFSFLVEYTRSLRPQKIANFLFGACALRFSGSRVAMGRESTDVLADYFGLAPDFSSSVTFTPRISNVIIDLNWYQGLDEKVTGLYYRIHVPIVHTKWDLHLQEFVNDSGMASHPAGYMASERVEMFPLQVKEALEGTTTFGDMREPLKFGKIFGRQTRSRVAELQAMVGWNFLQSNWYHFGFAIRAAAPTGNSPNAEFLFEPIIGNRHHWELGGSLTSHAVLWESVDRERSFAFYCDANITHLFNSKQKRSFDLRNNGAGSRYILISEILPPADDLLIVGQLAPSQYQSRLLPAINKTTLNATIHIDVQADIVLKFVYRRDGFEADIGYNFWGQSREKFKNRDCFEENRFGIKGDAQLYGFDDMDNPTALNATQGSATISAGQGLGNEAFANINVDNPAIANGLNQLNTVDANVLGIVQQNVQTSNRPLLLKDSAIDECSALLSRAISHKLFVHMDHVWNGGDDFCPYFGGGLAIEWACPCVRDNSAHSQWSIWLKTGLTY